MDKTTIHQGGRNMYTEQLANLRVDTGNFSHIEVAGTTCGAIALLTFKDRNGILKFPQAVLPPKGFNVRPEFDLDSFIYPIFFFGGEVEVLIRWDCDTIRDRKSIFAFITCISIGGEQAHNLHYLCPL